MFKGLWLNGHSENTPAMLAVREVALGIGSDSLDDSAAHILVYDDQNIPCAVGRLYPVQSGWRIDCIGVLPSHRKQGYGDLVMRMLLFRATQTYLQADIRATVPPSACAFFEKYGFVAAQPPAPGELVELTINGTQVSLSGTCEK